MPTNLTILFLLIGSAVGFTPHQSNFNTGQVSPLLEGRSDFEKYQSGTRQMQNMIPSVLGDVSKRPGTELMSIIPFNVTYEDSFEDTISVCPDGSYIHVIHGSGVEMDAGAITDYGYDGGVSSYLVGFPCTQHPYQAGQRIVIGGGVHPYDTSNGYIIHEVTTNEIICRTVSTHTAHTFAGGELIHQKVTHGIQDFFAGHGCVVGDYLYCGVDFDATENTCIGRVNINTWLPDTGWADAPPAGWYSTEFGNVVKASSDSQSVFMITYSGSSAMGRIIKYNISDGSIDWEYNYYDHPDPLLGCYGMDVDSSGRVYTGEFRFPYGDPGYYTAPVRMKADGSEVDVIYRIQADSGWPHASVFCAGLNESSGVIVFGGGENSSGSTIYTYPLNVFGIDDGSAPLQKLTYGSGCRILQALWVDNDLYLFGSGMYADGNTKSDGPYDIWKYNWNGSSLSLSAKWSGANYEESMWFGDDGNLWVMSDSADYTGEDKVTILDPDDLTLVEYKKFNNLTYSAGSNIIVSPEFIKTGGTSSRIWTEDYSSGEYPNGDTYRLIPFECSTDDSYVLGFGNNYMSLYRTASGQGGQIQE